MRLVQYLLMAAQLSFATVVIAAPSAWKIVPARSSLVFIATQNGAPVKGEFKKFSGDIHFDLDQLKDSKIKIVVDMNSVTSSFDDLTTTLQTPDWFNMKLFPEAVFESSDFTKLGANQYQAKGTLTIRDQSVPATLTFTAEQPTSDSALVKGSTTIKRTAFGVGQGEWASTSEIKDDVRVDFVVTAEK
jgi:polyisoprenoid-binding protein YceI